MKATYVMREPQQAFKVITGVLWPAVKSWLICGGGALVVSVKPETRSGEQNAKFHALCDDIAKSGTPWAGKTRNATEWKVLLVSGHAVATKEGCDIVPGIEGEFVNVRESTAAMSKARGSSLIEYSIAFCTVQGIKINYRDAA
jgi:hypothetical protein